MIPIKVSGADLLRRLKSTWIKRGNPVRLNHLLHDRYAYLERLDDRTTRPEMLREGTTMPSFPDDIASRAQILCRWLAGQDLRLVTAESCTGSLMAGSLAATSSSSGPLVGSFVTYRPSLKIAALGVSEAQITERTFYDPEVARQMAQGMLAGPPEADLALAITGVAGPGPDQGMPQGLVCVALAQRGYDAVVSECHFPGSPHAVLAAAIRMALDMGIAAIDPLRRAPRRPRAMTAMRTSLPVLRRCQTAPRPPRPATNATTRPVPSVAFQLSSGAKSCHEIFPEMPSIC